MNENFQNELDEIMDQYKSSRESILESQQKLMEVSETVTSKKGLVTVTMGAQGDVTRLTFNNRTYRDMAPAELAHVVVDTLKLARKRVEKQFVEAMPDTVLGGMSFEDLLGGKLELDKFLPKDFSFDGSPLLPNAPRSGKPDES